MEHKKLKLSVVLLALVLGLTVQAQQAITATGGDASGSGGSASYSIGQIGYTTYSGINGTVAAGVQQTFLNISLQLELVAFLQGAGINPNTGEDTLMRDDLRIAGVIPTTSPYADALTCDASVFNIIGSDAIVDWVYVQLRDENDNTTVIESQSALLLRSGDVVGVDGESALSFTSAAGNYFVSINHRNHLGVVSAAAVALSNTMATVDFTANAVVAQGGINALTDLGNGIFAAYAGDYDENAQVQNTDVTGVSGLTGSSGYSNADIDTNNQVQNTDLQNLVYPNSGKGQQFSKGTSTSKNNGLLTTGITVSFANAAITNDGFNDYYEIDVLIATDTDFKLGSGQFYITYNTAAFGTNVSNNNKIDFTQPAGYILGEIYGFFPAYAGFVQNDNTDSRVSLSFLQGVSAGAITADNVTTGVPKLLAHLKIEYTDVNEDPTIAFETGGVYLDQFYTACGPGTANQSDCVNDPGIQILNDTFDSNGAVLGVEDHALASVVMHPNPTTNTFSIEGLNEKTSLSIFDVTGKLILKQDNYLGGLVETSSFRSGLYLIKISNDQGVIVKRLLKQ